MEVQSKSPFSVLLLEKGKPKKIFKGWVWNDAKNAKVTLILKKGGEKIKVVKEYQAIPGKTAVMSCLQAVIKYWTKFDPAIHNVTILSGHEGPPELQIRK